MLRNGLLSGRLALKGGTAINLTVFDLPRLSVDIDPDCLYVLSSRLIKAWLIVPASLPLASVEIKKSPAAGFTLTAGVEGVIRKYQGVVVIATKMQSFVS